MSIWQSKLHPANSSTAVQALSGYQVKSMDPFSPVSKKTSATFTTPDGKSMMACKGAPQVGAHIPASAFFPPKFGRLCLMLTEFQDLSCVHACLQGIPGVAQAVSL